MEVRWDTGDYVGELGHCRSGGYGDEVGHSASGDYVRYGTARVMVI